MSKKPPNLKTNHDKNDPDFDPDTLLPSSSSCQSLLTRNQKEKFKQSIQEENLSSSSKNIQDSLNKTLKTINLDDFEHEDDFESSEESSPTHEINQNSTQFQPTTMSLTSEQISVIV